MQRWFNGRVTRWAVVALVALCLTGPSPREAHAQVRIVPGLPFDPDLEGQPQRPHRLFVSDREMSQRLAVSRDLLKKGETAQALSLLQSLLDNPEDFAFDADLSAGNEFQGSLKMLAERAVAELTPDARRIYELQYGTAARQLLEPAAVANDLALLEEATRRYFHTQAGAEAAYLLATYFLDHSEPRAAAIVFGRLRQSHHTPAAWQPMLSLKAALAWRLAGDDAKAVRTLNDLKATGAISLGGKQVPLFDNDADALDWLEALVGQTPHLTSAPLEQWSVFRGNPRRNAQVAGAAPVLSPAWSYPFITQSNYYDEQDVQSFERYLVNLDSAYRDSSFVTLPATHPILVNGTIVLRSLSNLRAVDCATGRVLWESTLMSPAFEGLLEEAYDVSESRMAVVDSPLKSFLTQRTWRDLTAGTLSSDGEHVFAIENLEIVNEAFVNAGQPVVSPGTDANTLTALELASGRLKWEIGGPRGDYELELAGSFFLGPPLPLQGNLYCLAEANGEIRLLVLEPASGRLLWSQSLVQPDAGLSQYLPRRLAGLSPSAADGIMVCPTAAGSVVAVDLARRMLLWGYRYERNIPPLPQDRRAALMAQITNYYLVSSKDDEDRWIDSIATLADGCAIVTPRDSDELHCLNLTDGTLRWKRRRGTGLYVGGVFEGKVLVVGRNEVRALNLVDGGDVWPEPTPIPNPSGRGFRDGHFYRLPLASGELATLDLRTGRISARTPAIGGLGNLIATPGWVVTQTIDGLLAYAAADELEQGIDHVLDEHPDDVAALLLRGELLLHKGEEARGLADLRRAWETTADEHSRQTLIATLLEGLRVDFATYRPLVAELNGLISEPEDRLRFLRLYGEGLRASGEASAAAAAYLQLARPDLAERSAAGNAGSLAVRSDHWLRPRLAELYSAADDAQRAAIDELCRQEIEAASAADADPAWLDSLAVACRGLPVGVPLLRRTIDDDRHAGLDLELRLRRLRDAAAHDEQQAAFATARQAQLLIDAGQARSAAGLLVLLMSKWADIECLPGRTGRELVDAWHADPAVVAALASSDPWPAGSFDVEKKIGRNGNIANSLDIEIIDGSSFLSEGTTLALDAIRKILVLRDGSGGVQWERPLSQAEAAYQYLPNRYARVHGQLLVVVLGGNLYAFDLLADAKSKNPLWDHALYEIPPDQPLDPRQRPPRWVGGNGDMSLLDRDPFGRLMGQLGPVTDECVYFQVGTVLKAVDPLSGNTLWERKNVLRGSDLFGDGEVLFVVAPDALEATVLRAADGLELGQRTLPPAGARLRAFGRNLLVWNPETGALSLIDVLSGQEYWRQTFGPGALARVVGSDEVAVLDSQGRFRLLDAGIGTARVAAEVDPIEGLDDFVVLRSQTEYILLSHSEAFEDPAGRLVIPTQSLISVNGQAHAFDRQTGKALWKAAVGQQALDASQPSELPILTLAAQTYLPNQPTLVRNQRPFALLILDKRTGQPILEDDSANTSRFEVVADRERASIEIRFNTFKVTLQTRAGEPAPQPAAGPT